MSEKIIELATKRRTARIFHKTSVNLNDIVYCLNVAVQAPSGANRQPWKFIMVKDPEVRKSIRLACEEQEKTWHQNVETNLEKWFRSKNITWQKSHLTDAPVLLAVFSNQKMPYATESTWLSIGYFTIALEERGLSTVTYTPPYPKDLQKLFNAPDEFRLEAIFPIGYSVDTKPKEERQPLQSLVYKDTWNTPFDFTFQERQP